MQKKNRGGFTLIELLAVIVILAIIALIAVPVIMNVITKARVSAFEDRIVKAGELYYSNQLLEPEGMTEDQEFTVDGNVFKNAEGKTLDISGSMPSSGKVIVTSEGKVALAISNGEYCIQKSTLESSVKAKKINDLESACDYKIETATPNQVFTTTTDEKAIPACITLNRKCLAGTKVGVQVNDTETYDFYIIEDNIEDNEITLIMDRNISNYTLPWYEVEDVNSPDTSNGPLIALENLEFLTAGWTNIPSETYTLSDTYNSEPMYTGVTRTDARARLLTMTEASNLGCGYGSEICPEWLYENTGSSYGNNGYWTSSAYANNSNYAWSVSYGGTSYERIITDVYYGIRPVITISKTIL